MSVLTDPSTYPISAAAARQLDRPLFGHVVDGEVVPSLDGGTMPVIDPATARRSPPRQPGRPPTSARRAVRARAFDDGPGATCRRSSRSAGCRLLPRCRRARRLAADSTYRLRPLRLYAASRAVRVDGLDYYSIGPRRCTAHPRGAASSPSPSARADRRRRAIHPERPTAARRRARSPSSPATASSSAGWRPDVVVVVASWRSGGHPARVSRRPARRERRRALSAHPRSTRSLPGLERDRRAIQAPPPRASARDAGAGGTSPSDHRPGRDLESVSRRDDGRVGSRARSALQHPRARSRDRPPGSWAGVEQSAAPLGGGFDPDATWASCRRALSASALRAHRRTRRRLALAGAPRRRGTSEPTVFTGEQRHDSRRGDLRPVWRA